MGVSVPLPQRPGDPEDLGEPRAARQRPLTRRLDDRPVGQGIGERDPELDDVGTAGDARPGELR